EGADNSLDDAWGTAVGTDIEGITAATAMDDRGDTGGGTRNIEGVAAPAGVDCQGADGGIVDGRRNRPFAARVRGRHGSRRYLPAGMACFGESLVVQDGGVGRAAAAYGDARWQQVQVLINGAELEFVAVGARVDGEAGDVAERNVSVMQR